MEEHDSRQRQALLALLRSSSDHLSADEVYEEMKKTMPHISKGTVYRNLRSLRQKGLISALDLVGTLTRFEGRHDPHYHFLCERCGRVFDLDVPVDPELDRRVEQHTGCTVTGHHLEFHGLCARCRCTQPG